MRKLAIFVEGQTEQIFVREFLKSFASQHSISIEEADMRGKKKIRTVTLIKHEPPNPETEFYILVYNSGSDEIVNSDMRELRSKLTNNGYEKIIGLRDLYPKNISEKATLERSFQSSLRNQPGIPIHLIFAVMEFEAWFLAEWTHFQKIDPRLTTDFIQQEFGFNPEIDNMENRPHPAEDLDLIYQRVGRCYDKTKAQVEEIVSNLDFDFICLDVVNRVDQLKLFVKQITTFLSIEEPDETQ
ncbi:DUF4276 family protein [Planktothrix agardhii 1806]|jgi:hypothetical protein|uniref:Uncharacterized protein n=1 Tax=Planktothrix agardhii TaxID=1160 RepID=A0A1J1JHI3_PLAAG|nr:DUF4276 family protein [Planktothrix agardhii]MCF3608124.1 DUF4276 family protein [Planktothrix agardhii 1033]BBD54853.1 hypothetical protein NIES204_21500 [Planktothrix agardhii NIES-204]MBG0745546.1 DUF4276 family protein [Planktothrix agardhii KL2]MCB8752212.1 DUF4276 family protein [Planktothrix agardhii 1810]MCB8761258.1 DUF4276 family protein [Planktothrix agardhii 1813]